jgi:hypothetical protein
MTLEDIDRMVREANPVPDERLLGPMGATDMPLDGRTPPVTSRRTSPTFRARTILVVAAAAVGVLVAVGAGVLLSRGATPATDQPTPPDPPSAEVEVAERFMEARSTHDLDAIQPLLADSPVNVNLPYWHKGMIRSWDEGAPYSSAKLALAFEIEAIYDVTYESVECREVPAGGFATAGVPIRCSARMDSRLLRTAGIPPREVHTRLGVDDGKVDLVGFAWWTMSLDPDDIDPTEMARFVDWLYLAHPSGIVTSGSPATGTAVFEWEGQIMVHILERGSVDLLADHVDEYQTAGPVSLGSAPGTVIRERWIDVFGGAPEDEPPLWNKDSSAAAVAQYFMEARDAHNMDAMLPMLPIPTSPDRDPLSPNDGRVTLDHMVPVDRDGSPVARDLEPEQVALALEVERVLGVRYEEVECMPLSAPDSINVRCVHTTSSRLSAPADRPPYEASSYFRVYRGDIILLTTEWLRVSESGDPAELAEFVAWLRAEHPTAIDPTDCAITSDECGPAALGSIYRGSDTVWFIPTPENIDLLAGYLEEYEQASGAGG